MGRRRRSLEPRLFAWVPARAKARRSSIQCVRVVEYIASPCRWSIVWRRRCGQAAALPTPRRTLGAACCAQRPRPPRQSSAWSPSHRPRAGSFPGDPQPPPPPRHQSPMPPPRFESAGGELRVNGKRLHLKGGGVERAGGEEGGPPRPAFPPTPPPLPPQASTFSALRPPSTACTACGRCRSTTCWASARRTNSTRSASPSRPSSPWAWTPSSPPTASISMSTQASKARRRGRCSTR